QSGVLRLCFFSLFFTHAATTVFYPLSLHDALPIFWGLVRMRTIICGVTLGKMPGQMSTIQVRVTVLMMIITDLLMTGEAGILITTTMMSEARQMPTEPTYPVSWRQKATIPGE